MFPRILSVIIISHGLLAAQEPTATEPPTNAELAIATPVVDQAALRPAPIVGSVTAIIGPIADGTVSLPAPPRVMPDLKVRSSTTKKIMREEPSGVAGLPPARKEVKLTMHLVEGPHLPEPPPPPPPADMNDPAVLAWRAEVSARYQEPEYVFVTEPKCIDLPAAQTSNPESAQ